MSAVGLPYELPPEKEQALQQAKHVIWISMAALLSTLIALSLTMGASQAMKAMWLEDTLSFVPMIAFLIGARFRKKDPDEKFPYGYRRAVLIGFLCGAVALFSFGIYLLGDSGVRLMKHEHPTIQTVGLFGQRIWLGWPMIGALVYSVFPPLIMARFKLPLASELHDKVLYVSATLDKGDWLSAVAAAGGILGIAFGYWWADAVAGAIISVEIIEDGYINLRNSVSQLMNKRPSDVEGKKPDPAADNVQKALEKLPWVAAARVRLREDGDVLTGEAFVVPRDERNMLKHLEEATQIAANVDWRLHDVNIVPVRSVK